MAMIDNPTLQDLAESFGISAETLGDLLVFYPVTGAGLNMDVSLPPDIAELNRRDDRGEDLTDEERDKLKNGIYIAGAYVINNYLDTVEADPEKYRPEIQKIIDELTQDRHEDETLEECINRVLSKCGLRFTISPAESETEHNDILSQPYSSMLNTEIINLLFTLSLDDFNKDPYSHIATYTKNGETIEISNYEDFQDLTSRQLGLFDTAVLYLTDCNYIPGNGKDTNPDTIQTTVEIPLIDYAKARGTDLTPKIMDTKTEQRAENTRVKNLKRQFVRRVRSDLNVLDRIAFTGIESRGDTPGKYHKMPLILNNHSVTDDYIKISFDDQLAYLLVTSYIMQYSPKLLSLNGSNPSNIRVGRYLLLHASMYNNRKRGTDLTLSVKSIIGATSSIPSLEELEEREERDPGKKLSSWKGLAKKPFEQVMNSFIKADIITAWQYRDPKTGDTLTSEQIQKNKKMTANTFYNLRIDYILHDEMPEIPVNKAKSDSVTEVGVDA